ncbi:MAG: helix-turn-helix transcriptional regulator [Lachnospiraceae bacterium]|nr:helix-turn-helix transcriptional regulator [Lachnospiraceae bacterium]
MEIDYKAIGVRVKRLRKEQKLSQEKLAELVDISVPHMSNIETGKTKLSMQVLVDISNALSATPDELLLGYTSAPDKKCYTLRETIHQELEDCTTAQVAMIEDVIVCTKRGLRQYERKTKKQQ